MLIGSFEIAKSALIDRFKIAIFIILKGLKDPHPYLSVVMGRANRFVFTSEHFFFNDHFYIAL